MMTRVNALSGLYLISTWLQTKLRQRGERIVSMPSRAYTSFLRQQQKRNIPVRYQSVNALSGLYLISTPYGG